MAQCESKRLLTEVGVTKIPLLQGPNLSTPWTRVGSKLEGSSVSKLSCALGSFYDSTRNPALGFGEYRIRVYFGPFGEGPQGERTQTTDSYGTQPSTHDDVKPSSLTLHASSCAPQDIWAMGCILYELCALKASRKAFTLLA